MPVPTLVYHSGAIDSFDFDAVVAVLDPDHDAFASAYPALNTDLRAVSAVDSTVEREVSLVVSRNVAGRRAVISPTGPLNRDYDTVERIVDATRKGVRRAVKAGAKSPLLLVNAALLETEGFEKSVESLLLGALQELYEPLEARESLGEEEIEVVKVVGWQLYNGDLPHSTPSEVIRIVTAIENGRRLARDVGGSDPERMAPLKCAEFIETSFAQFCDTVRVTKVTDLACIRHNFPLLAAVARCSEVVERHRPVVVRLEYGDKDSADLSLAFAGKGVTYDTGGADVKAGGIMSGMCRDKCGASAVAGFMRTLAELKPKKLHVIAYLGMVRNSIGADAYVADEIITSHAGVRVRVGNTDAEGRMVMADLLSHCREEVSLSPSLSLSLSPSKSSQQQQRNTPQIFSVATLTGHAVKAVGPFSICMENGPAKRCGIARALQASGDAYNDCWEISTLRRCDYDFISGASRPTLCDDLLQCNNAASSQTVRGHQFPAAFMAIASGLDQRGKQCPKSEQIAYTHIDMAGSADECHLGKVTGRPIPSLVAAYVLPRC